MKQGWFSYVESNDMTESKLKAESQEFISFQFGLCHVVVPLSFLSSNQPCFVIMFLFLPADQIFYRFHVYQQHFRLQSFASLYLLNILARVRLVKTHHVTESTLAITRKCPSDIPQFSKLRVLRKILKVTNNHNNLILSFAPFGAKNGQITAN